jgi:6-phosphogluconolactonase (cycloisomerase 2 family)
MSAGPDVFLFVGSYAGRISTLSFSPAKAALTVVHATDKAGKSPSWLAAHPTSERILLASDENDGQIVAFEVAPSGELRCDITRLPALR